MSLYKLIENSILENGVLQKDFSLPKEKEEGKLQFVDGGMDGIFMYHMMKNEANIEELGKALILANKKKNRDALKILHKYFEKERALAVIDDLHKWIIDNQNILDANIMYNFAVNIILNEDNIEVIKFGLSILELISSDDEDLKRVIRNFALSDEFTLFSLFIMRGWENGNTEIFEIAKKVKGWGRIFAVEQLEPENNEIKKWLLLEGWNNEIMPQYSALTCAIKGDIFNVIADENISKDEVVAIGNIITYLIQEGPVAGISAIEDPELIFEYYLNRANEFSDVEDVEVVKVIIEEYRTKGLEK